MRSVAVILCAGESSRLGECKALVHLHGSSYLRRVVDAFVRAGVDEVRVVLGGSYEHEIRRAWSLQTRSTDKNVSILHNPDPSPGPIASLRTGLTSGEPADLYFSHPVDIPGIQSPDVAALLTQARAAADSAVATDASVPTIDGRRAHPVLFRHRCVKQVMESATLRDFMTSPEVKVLELASTNRWLRFDVDTPEDRARLQQEFPPAG